MTVQPAVIALAKRDVMTVIKLLDDVIAEGKKDPRCPFCDAQVSEGEMHDPECTLGYAELWLHPERFILVREKLPDA